MAQSAVTCDRTYMHQGKQSVSGSGDKTRQHQSLFVVDLLDHARRNTRREQSRLHYRRRAIAKSDSGKPYTLPCTAGNGKAVRHRASILFGKGERPLEIRKSVGGGRRGGTKRGGCLGTEQSSNIGKREQALHHSSTRLNSR